MHYLGGKFRIRDKIAGIINELEGDMYVEPFCGACWVGERVTKPVKVFIDVNKYLIAMWQEVQKGWSPPWKVSEEEYKDIKDDYSNEGGKYPDYLIGFVGFACSFGGKFFGGYARRSKGMSKTEDYSKYGSSSVIEAMSKGLATANFVCKRYSKVFASLMMCSQRVIVYCDPPYKGTTKYYGTPEFDYERFWHNVEIVSKRHYVLVSSYDAPEGIECIMEISTKLNLTGGARTERVFGCGAILDDYEWEIK
jgi:DNA adenine methylase